MITLVGCGFLGSLVAEELAKRLYAFNDTNTNVLLVDFDKIEERNAANQNFTLNDVGMTKVDAVSMILQRYKMFPFTANRYVDKTNIDETLHGTDLLISAVDNLPTRRLLWYWARAKRLPLMHMGVSQQGTGSVEWTVNRYDTWSLAPVATLGQTENLKSEANLPKELKPCELVAFRGLGLNMAIAGAKAIGIFRGMDPEKTVGADVLPGTATTWDATTMGHTLRRWSELTEEELFGVDHFAVEAA